VATLLPDEVSESVDRLNRMLRKKAEEARARAHAELQDSKALAGRIQELRRVTEENIASGFEGRRLLFALRETREALRMSIAAYGESRVLVVSVEGGLETLVGYVQEAESFLARVDSLIAWLEAVPPKIDPGSLPHAEGPAGEAEGFGSLEDLTAGGS
jgi:hypothetical protein